MGDEKPMRHEDYLAIAEENRQLHTNNHLLTARIKDLEHKKPRWKIIVGDVCWGMACIFIWQMGCLLGAHFATPKVEMHKKEKRKTPCFYIKQNDTDGISLPWYPWRVYRSNCEDCNPDVIMPPEGVLDFATKEVAWSFLQKWKLETCK